MAEVTPACPLDVLQVGTVVNGDLELSTDLVLQKLRSMGWTSVKKSKRQESERRLMCTEDCGELPVRKIRHSTSLMAVVFLTSRVASIGWETETMPGVLAVETRSRYRLLGRSSAATLTLSARAD